MRIVHFVESFSPLSETFVYDYIIELERQGVENHVVTLVRQNESARPFPRVQLVKLPTRWHPERIWSRIVANAGLVTADEQYWSFIRRRIANILRELAPDVIHAHFGPAGVLIAPLCSSLPLVTSFYGFDASRLLQNELWQPRFAQLLQDANAIICLSESMQRDLLASVNVEPEKLIVIHLAKRLADYPFSRRVPPLKRWVSVGRIAEKKGHFDAVQAFAWATKGADVTLEIVGSGPLELSLRDYLQENQLQDRVHLLGALPHQLVIEKLKHADAFILASKTASDGDKEGTPTVLLEAQAVGLPCISTIHAGIPEIIPHQNHWLLAPEGDVAAIAECIAQLRQCTVEELRAISTVGRTKVELEFRIETETSKLRQLYGVIANG